MKTSLLLLCVALTACQQAPTPSRTLPLAPGVAEALKPQITVKTKEMRDHLSSKYPQGTRFDFGKPNYWLSKTGDDFFFHASYSVKVTRPDGSMETTPYDTSAVLNSPAPH